MSTHQAISPAAHIYQSDVETVNRLEEDEFFDLESFSSRGDFLAEVHISGLLQLGTAQFIQRKSHPLADHRAAHSSFSARSLFAFTNLDYYLGDEGGYDVPRLPYVND